MSGSADCGLCKGEGTALGIGRCPCVSRGQREHRQSALERVYFDLLAYGRHFEACTKGRELVPGRGGRPAIRDKACSCGLDSACENAETAIRAASPGSETGEAP